MVNKFRSFPLNKQLLQEQCNLLKTSVNVLACNSKNELGDPHLFINMQVFSKFKKLLLREFRVTSDFMFGLWLVDPAYFIENWAIWFFQVYIPNYFDFRAQLIAWMIKLLLFADYFYCNT